MSDLTKALGILRGAKESSLPVVGPCFNVTFTPEERAALLAAESMQKLWKVCECFIRERQIGCAETIYQVDSVAENSPEFIERICDIVGYAPDA